jgi:hypothetical protein
MVAAIWFAQPAAATSDDSTSKGLAISPAFSQLELKTTDQRIPYQVSIANRSDVPQLFTLSAVDFGSLDEEGGVAFLGQSQNVLDRKHGLAAWMTLDRNSVTVPARSSVDVKVGIENGAGMSPGGHYGAILATAQTDSTAGTARSRVGVRQVLSSLILLIKGGGARSAMDLVSGSNDAQWWRLPSKVTQRFKSTGNVHVVPRGTIEVVDPFGRVVRRGALNAGSGAVLPDTVRRYRTPLDTVAVAWSPGPYRIVTSYRPENVDTVTKHTATVWFAGAIIVWVMVLTAVLAVWGLVWWLWWRKKH